MIFTRADTELHIEVAGRLWLLPEAVRGAIVQPHLPDFVLRGTAIVGPTGWWFNIDELVGLAGSTPPPYVPRLRPKRRMGLDEFALFAVPHITLRAVEGEPYVPSEPWVRPKIIPLGDVTEL